MYTRLRYGSNGPEVMIKNKCVNEGFRLLCLPSTAVIRCKGGTRWGTLLVTTPAWYVWGALEKMPTCMSFKSSDGA